MILETWLAFTATKAIGIINRAGGSPLIGAGVAALAVRPVHL
jgi:hypothetical protein